MKLLLCVAAIIAVGSAAKIGVMPVPAGPASLVDENGNPISIGPVFIDGSISPIAIGPAIIDHSPIDIGPAVVEAGDIAVGPAIIDFPLPDGGAISAPVEADPVAVSPVSVGGQSSPLVQIIVNVQGQSPVAPSPVVEPVHVVDEAVNEEDKPINIIDMLPIGLEPINIIDMIPIGLDVDPVKPIAVEPVQIGTPIFPSPAITLPEELN